MKLAVIGRGLIGSAAARHLSKMGHEVALIGPGEPADFPRHDGVFGSHYDEGRITRTYDPQAFWRQMNRAAIARYGEIAAESGVDFYREAGALHVGNSETTDVASVGQVCADEAIGCEAYRDAALAERFPFLQSTSGMLGYFEPRNAGYISPRRLVRAQAIAAEHAGARIIDEAALGISETASGVTIRTRSGNLEAERVLVAAGGHTQSLLGRSLGVTVYARTAALFRLDRAEVERLAGMPSMRCLGPKGDNPYILPPIPYPDGQTWLKLGGDPVDRPLGSEADIKDWFRSGGSVDVADHLQAQILDRIRDLEFEERRVVPCMTSFGDTGLPLIGPLSERVTVAFCCYGKSAKCSDELGRLGALALLGEVRAELAP
ncbi:MAG: N-methyl-l-tryptophan oxidase [Bradyrhizobium sp. PARBB1]|nr:FAD-dependent oxidoreductase [Bradyrhizobium sp.]OYU57913.1 MAG: N-methyl-l-tryptophan oxidase [Bradyrhizobium sp. PARBB1]PSO24431.1 N-methyl-l-tryptophan oxidase [Bradyrhizobium sp. MOS004]MCA3579610.1 FAD-dependent oxidoreductase [Bradyrhizobium sp.]HAQ83007.1 FAD-dependent oxidoreductase [Bradyrhizobium sp.]